MTMPPLVRASSDKTDESPTPSAHNDPGPATALKGSEDIDLSHSNILIVDDNAQNVELIQAYLEALPCKTTVAYNGIEAMKIIDSTDYPKPDLVLLDVMMPKMSGFEVCRKIKENPATRAIPVMMVTALNELGDIERGVESGTDDFLTKPVNKLELITRVKSLLRVRHLKRELDRTVAYIQDIESRGQHQSEQSDEAEHGDILPEGSERLESPGTGGLRERDPGEGDTEDPGQGPIA